MSQTAFTLMVFSVMTGVFMVSWWRGLPHILSIVLAAIAGALVAGHGVPLRHLVEGTFMFFDLVVVILTATIFVGVVRESGALAVLIQDVTRLFHKRPLILLILMTFVVMLPGALTGSGTAAVLTVGSLVGSVLVNMGIPVVNVVAIVALAGVIGSFAPPVNIPAMAIANGINMPYVGFFVPLAFVSIPLAVVTSLWLGARHIKRIEDVDQLFADLSTSGANLSRFAVYTPFVVVLGLLVVQRVFPDLVPELGTPIVFAVGILVAIALSRGVNLFKVAQSMIREALPVAGLLIGVGTLVQIMALTGVRGLFVITSITLPTLLLYLFVFVGFAVSGSLLGSYGSGTVFGIPVMMALLDRDPIIATVGLSLMAAYSSLTPPTAVVGYASAIALNYTEGYGPVLRRVIMPWVVASVIGVLIVIFADNLRFMVRY